MFGVGVGIRVGGFTPSGGVAPYVGLLDTYPGAAAAYSVRLLKSDYTGSAIRVRRSSDNAESDIGFSGGNLDESALTSFCSGTNGFVTTFYDQSGNSLDLTQSTAANQPQIVSSGSVILQNTKPAMQFFGNETVQNSFTPKLQPQSIFSVSRNTTASFGGTFGDNFQQANRVGVGYYFIASNFGNVAVDTENSNNIITSFILDGSNSKCKINNNTQLTGNAFTQTQSAIKLGAGNYFGAMTGFFQEYVQWPTNQNSNESQIRTNQNTYYAIY